MTTENEKQKQITPDFEEAVTCFFDAWGYENESDGKIAERAFRFLYSSPAALEKMGLVKKEEAMSPDDLTAVHFQAFHSRDDEVRRLEVELAEARRKLEEAKEILKMFAYDRKSIKDFCSDIDDFMKRKD